jgi:hypothetical protein
MTTLALDHHVSEHTIAALEAEQAKLRERLRHARKITARQKLSAQREQRIAERTLTSMARHVSDQKKGEL